MKFKADNAYYLKNYSAAREIALQATSSKAILQDKVRHRDWLDLLAHCLLHLDLLEDALACMNEKVSGMELAHINEKAPVHGGCFYQD